MLTDQHLMVYGHLTTALDQASVLLTFCALVRVADPHQFYADPDPAYHFNADRDTASHFYADPDLDPAPHQNYKNMRPLVCRSSREPL
jgi:hypothetical protein